MKPGQNWSLSINEAGAAEASNKNTPDWIGIFAIIMFTVIVFSYMTVINIRNDVRDIKETVLSLSDEVRAIRAQGSENKTGMDNLNQKVEKIRKTIEGEQW